MSYKTMAVVLVVAAAIAAFSFKLGQRDAERGGDGRTVTTPILDVDDAQSSMPANHPVLAAESDLSGRGGKAGFSDGAKVAQFQIGNRNVKRIYAENGSVWIGTSGGVIHYDPATDDYKVFDNSTPGILSNGVFHVGPLGGKIAVGTYGGGLSVLDRATGTWRNYNIPDGLADQFVYDVETASNGDVWIATWSGANRVRGGNLDDVNAWETFTVENTEGGLPNPWVYGVEEGRDGAMWFATEAGLARYAEGKWQHWQHGDGLGAPFQVVRDTIQFTNDPAKASSHHAQQKQAQGLADVDVAYNPNYIISLEVDGEGNVWAGTWGGGLARFDGSRWKNYTTADGLPGNHIFMLYLDTAGKLWAGTSKGLARFNAQDESFTVMTTRDGLYADNVFSMANAADGSVWVGSFGGLVRFGAGEWRL